MSLGIRAALGWGNDGEESTDELECDEAESDEFELAEDDDEDGDELVNIDVLVQKTYTQTVIREQIEIIWCDGTTSTKRWCDQWEKRDGDYVLENSREQVVWGSPHAKTKLRHIYETELQVPEDNVKALDVVDSSEWEAEAEHPVEKPVTMPEDDLDSFETEEKTRRRNGGFVKVSQPIMDRETYDSYRAEYSDE